MVCSAALLTDRLDRYLNSVLYPPSVRFPRQQGNRPSLGEALSRLAAGLAALIYSARGAFLAMAVLLSCPIIANGQIQGGATPIPTDAPPTGPSRVLPHPATGPQDAFHPIPRSPDLAAIGRFASDHPLTLDDAISIGLATNPALAQSR